MAEIAPPASICITVREEPLSERNMDVLRLIADDQSNSNIAQALFISISAQKTYVKHIYGKLKVYTRKTASPSRNSLSISKHSK
jgi:LuxR family maltose regulon positive regulatory protein